METAGPRRSRSAALASVAAACAALGVPAGAAGAPPAVSIADPGAGGRVWGTTTVVAEARDEDGVARVELLVDGVERASDESAPYELSWNARDLPAGTTATLTARATDAAGEASLSAPVGVVAARRLPMGAAVGSHLLDGSDERYRETVLAHYDSLTPENEMKMWWVQPYQDVFDFGPADRIVALAEANGKAVRGHTLVWGQALPDWVTGRTWTREELLQVLERHIKRVVGHYRGRVGQWEVVNEAFENDGSFARNVWHDTIGPEYVELAFRWAHEADPGAELFLNDWGAEGIGPKSDAIHRFLGELRARGVPVHGFGMQAHVFDGFRVAAADLAENMRRFRDLGLGVELTEMDVPTRHRPGSTADRLLAQAETYRRYAAVCQAEPACRRLTTWGFTDATSWLGQAEMPLPFDAEYRAKSAYHALVDELARTSGPAPAPQTALTGAPPRMTASTQAVFGFSSPDANAGFECGMDGRGWRPCSAPKVYTDLPEGGHVLEVRARDGTAKVDPTPVRHEWVVDTVAPTVTLTEPAAGAQIPAEGGLAIGGKAGAGAGDGASVTVGIWAGNGAEGAPTQTLRSAVVDGRWSVDVVPALLQGTYTARAEQRDEAGNAGQSAPVTFTVVGAPPGGDPPPPTPPPVGTVPPGGGSSTPPPEGSQTPPGAPTIVDTGARARLTIRPDRVSVSAGRLLEGGASRLWADDDRHLRASSTSGSRATTGVVAWFRGVRAGAARLRVLFRARHSRRCAQSLDLWDWRGRRWRRLAATRADSRERLVAPLVGMRLRDHVRRDGMVAVRARCSAAAGFVTLADLLTLSVDR